MVSGGELYTAIKADFPMEKILFHGNNKSTDELALALDHRVGRIVVDNFYELQLLAQLAADRDQVVDVLLRISPGVEAHTHSYIQTGQLDSKFGFAIAHDVALKAVELALKSSHLNLKGIHCHIGSQIFDISSFVPTVERMLGLVKDIAQTFNYPVSEVDLGGGLGIRYQQGDTPVGPEALAQLIATEVDRVSSDLGIPRPTLIVEPGRSIVGEAGLTLYTVGSIKDIPGIRRYVAVDGGMNDNPRVALYQARYEAVVANRMHAAKEATVSIAGKCCESGDMLIHDIELPHLHPGDILAVFSTGAYNYSMASNYNRLPRPAVVLVSNGQADLIVKRETYEDLIRLDLIPQRLQKDSAVTTGRE